MLQLFQPGDKIFGYCNGCFGRDDYEDKTVIAVRPKYVLFEYDNGCATVLNAGDSRNITPEMVAKWKLPYDSQEV